MSYSKYDRIPCRRGPSSSIKYRVKSVGETREYVVGYIHAKSNHEATVKARVKFGEFGFSRVEQM